MLNPKPKNGKAVETIAALNQNVDYIKVDLSLYEETVYLSHNPIKGNQLNQYVTFQDVLKLLKPEKVT